MNRSWLSRRNPCVKLGVVLVVSLAVMLLIDPGPVLVLYLLALLGAATAGRVTARALLLGQAPFALFAVGIVLVNAVTRPRTPVLSAGPLTATREGLLIGLALALRTLLIGVLTIALLASTPPRALMVSLIHDARLSPRYAYAVLAGHRMLVSMPERWRTIRAAQRVRGPERGRRGAAGIGAFDSAAFTLLVTAVRSSERIALALESRGLGREERTLWRAPAMAGQDLAMALVVVGVVGSVVCLERT